MFSKNKNKSDNSYILHQRNKSTNESNYRTDNDIFNTKSGKLINLTVTKNDIKQVAEQHINDKLRVYTSFII
jgi:hypothetical protein